MPLAFGRPDNPAGKIIHLESQLDLLCRRHLPPDGHLLGIQRAQPAAKVFGQVKDGRRGFT